MTNGGWNAAVAGLYEAFASYPLRERIDACPCCGAGVARQPLHTKELQDLTSQDLAGYAFRAMTTVGDADDFRHFLPRIFELLRDDFPIDPKVVLGKLRYAGWISWPGSERRAVERFFHELWSWAIDQDPLSSFREVESWLCALARAENDVSAYLAEWASATHPAARANLAAFLQGFVDGVRQPEPDLSYWADALPQWRQVQTWVQEQTGR